MLDKKSHGKRPANVRTVPCRDSKRHLDFLHLKFSMIVVSVLQRRLADGITSRPRKVGERLKAVNARHVGQIMGEASSSRLQDQGCGWERVQVMGKLRFYRQETHPNCDLQAKQLGLRLASFTTMHRIRSDIVSYWDWPPRATAPANRDGRHHEPPHLPIARSPDRAKPISSHYVITAVAIGWPVQQLPQTRGLAGNELIGV
jgi:hypothetical protein